MTDLRSVTAVALACACLAGCGSATSGSVAGIPTLLRAGDLPGWRAVSDTPGIAELAPDLSGLHVAARADPSALVRAGDVVRATALVFPSSNEAEEALKRASGDDYQAALERAFRGDTVARGPGVAYTLRVPRPTGVGADTVEIILIRNGRRVTIVELVSGARRFDPSLRARVLALVSR